MLRRLTAANPAPVAIILLAAVALCLAGARSLAADGVDGWTGTLTSQRLEPLPETQVFDVEIYDDTRENLAFRDRFLAALRKAGHATADNAPLVFSFATGITWRRQRAQELARRKQRQQPTNFEEATFPLDAWRLESGEYSSLLFGARQSAGIPVRDASEDQLDITAQIRDHRNGRILWQAELTLPLLAPDRPRIARSIIGPIIEAAGKTVENRQFDIH